jgi:putative ABC transport system permease protein
MRAVTLGSVRMYARRYVAAGIAVVLGVGFVIVATSMGSAAREGVRASLGEQYAAADVVVQLASPRDARALAALGGSDGVAATSTSWTAYLPDDEGSDSYAVLGSVTTAHALRWQQLRGGELPSAQGEVAVSAAYADTRELEIGDVLELRLGGTEPTVTGIVDNAVGVDRADVYAPESVLSSLRVAYPVETVLLAAPGTDARALVATVAAALPDVDAVTASAYVDDLASSLTGGVDVIGHLLLGFALVALFVAAMVVANTFTIVLAQRARDVALLRCVGAQRAQLVRSVVMEAGVVGLATAAAGVVVGLGVTAAVVSAIGDRFADVPLAMPDLAVAALVVPWLAGALVTVLSAVVPALRASRVAPLAALRMDDRIDVRSTPGAVRLVAALLAIGTGLAALLAGASGEVGGIAQSLVLGIAGGMLSFVGVLWAGPVLVPAAVRLIGQPARAAGVPGRLALANSARNPKRTAATAMALLVGVTLISMLTIGTASSQATAERLNDDNLPIDVAVSATSLDEAVVQSLLAVEGVDTGAVLQGTPVRVAGRRMRVAGVDAAHVADVLRSEVGVVPGDDELLLPHETLYQLGLEPGDEVSVAAGGSRVRLVARAGDAWGAPLLVSATTFDRLATDVAPAAVWLRAVDDGDAAAMLTAIDEIAGDAAVAGGLGTRAQLDRVLSVVLAIATGLLAVAVLIALVGVGNTLSLSVLERTRENALLRALGLTGTQMRTMLALEALLLTAVAAVLGIGLGALYAWFGVRTLLGPEFGSDIEYVLPLGQVAVVVVVAVLAGLVASWLPARRAARTAPVAAL